MSNELCDYLSINMPNLTIKKLRSIKQKGMTPFTSQTKKQQKPLYLKTAIFIVILILLAGAFYVFVVDKKEIKRSETVAAQSDGSVEQVVKYLKETELENPDSFTAIHWSKLQKTTDMLGITTYKVALIYKAKNNKNEFIMESKIFELDESGNIMFALDVEPMKKQ